uniref:Photosystem I reaction center subunit II n=2 Tax=Gracilariopsis TaxID=2781 RepID=A0A1C9CEP9_9FLOR|nr:photosystem I reaction center subunit II [Gracilariopsis lemaneiformis]YP_009294610.1 photosystem I subunit II [Gracilariopsis chorda]AJO68451.1 photosystem I subunit II [Gracilariopsis lemaneiformis]AML79847.1 photosystem I reaction center subunit II [Gracilariopsis lemaneiformis]AOM66870.1 photosystem I subunit II [Gracilariopsis chorda]UAD88869.1 photosystem I reaction center subunit II [Gracilariopsis chorda]
MNNTIDLKMPSPTFGGSTGGWLRSAEIEEKYAITWTSKQEQIFEMPTGGSAIMREGNNLLYLAKKEQCLALSSQLNTKFKITDFKIYRIFPNGEVQYLHPKDGVFPEKVNAGRSSVGNISHSIGKNKNPVNEKFTGKATYE